MAGTQGTRGVRVFQDGERLVIRWRRLRRVIQGCGDWVKEGIFFLIGLAFFGFPASAYIPRILQGDWAAFKWGDLVTAPFVLIGAFVVYRGLTVLVNNDVITVTSETIRVRGRPLPPWDMETPTIPRREIARVEAKVRTLSSGNKMRHAGVTHNYDVVAVLHDGKTRDVIAGSTTPEPAHYVANEITKFMETLR